MRRKISIIDFFMQILLTLCFAELVFPPLTVLASQYFVCLFCIVGWFALSIIKDRFFYLRCPLYVVISCLYVLMVIIIPYLFGYPVIGNRYSAILLVPFGYVIYKFHQQHRTLKVIEGSIIIAIILSIITAIITLDALIQDETISRSIKSSGAYSEALAAKGIGGYFFIYYAAILGPIALQCMMCKHNKKQRLLYGSQFALYAFLVFKSNYTTALLMLVASSSVLIMFHVFRESSNRTTYVILATVLVCGIYILGDTLWEQIVSIMPERVAEIFSNNSDSTVLEQLANEFFSDRWPTMQNSIDAFFASPLFGIVVSGGIGTRGVTLNGFGQHSHILDTFALYGFGIGLLTIYLAFLPFRRKDRSSDLGFTLAILISAVIVYFFNNATNSIAFAISIIYPYVRDSICLSE